MLNDITRIFVISLDIRPSRVVVSGGVHTLNFYHNEITLVTVLIYEQQKPIQPPTAD